MRNTILVLGAQRSGTTWLGKILDSHPDVLYRHEPDEAIRPPACLDDAAIAAVLETWVSYRDPRSTTQRPFFAKSWQPVVARVAWRACAYALGAAARLPAPFGGLGTLPIPDLSNTTKAQIVIKSIRWSDGVGAFTRWSRSTRTILILRHPCGQVSSIMRGIQQQRFRKRSDDDLPYNENEARLRAAQHGVNATSFAELPNAAKFAWAWVAFNETVLRALDGQPNARIVLYEDLCHKPEQTVRALLDFAALNWNAQTANFVVKSTTHGGKSGYYAVLKNSVASANRWQTTMSVADQEAVRAVVRRTRLAAYWPDIADESLAKESLAHESLAYESLVDEKLANERLANERLANGSLAKESLR